MKTFLRTGSFYKAESPSLSDDLDITELFAEKNIVQPLNEETAFETHLSELNKRVDKLREMYDALTKVPDKQKVVKAKNTPASKPAKSNSKKDSTKKK